MTDNQQEGTDAADRETVRADEPKYCSHCGARIDTSEWHPLETRTEQDGRFRVYAFCDERCRTEWADEDADDRAAAGDS